MCFDFFLSKKHVDHHEQEKREEGDNKYRYIAVGVIGAIIALYAYNPRGFVKGVITVYNDGYYVGKC